MQSERRRLHTAANKHILAFTILEMESLGGNSASFIFLQRYYFVKKEDDIEVKVKQAGVDRGLKELQQGTSTFI